MKRVTVSTKNELKRAKDSGASEIYVIGELADQLKKAKSITYIGAGTIAVLTAAIAAAPFTGGISRVAGFAPVAALTGLEIATIIIAASIGISLIIAVFNGYEEIEYEKGKMTLRKKKSS